MSLNWLGKLYRKTQPDSLQYARAKENICHVNLFKWTNPSFMLSPPHHSTSPLHLTTALLSKWQHFDVIDVVILDQELIDPGI